MSVYIVYALYLSIFSVCDVFIKQLIQQKLRTHKNIPAGRERPKASSASWDRGIDHASYECIKGLDRQCRV